MKECATCRQRDGHAEWCPGSRVVRGRPIQASAATEERRSIRIFEDYPDRPWKPEEKATDAVMNLVLEILMRRRVALQADLAEEVAAVLGVKMGTARAYVSASLLFFREAGWVRLRAEDRTATLWEIEE